MSIGPIRMTFGILLIAVGVISFVVFLVTSLTRVFGGLQRVKVPGVRELALEPGDHTIYWEADSRLGSLPSFSDLDLSVVSKGGESRTVSPSGVLTGRYTTMEGRVGASIAVFSVDWRDLYAVKVAPAAGRSLPKGGIAVGRSLGFLGVLKIVLTCVVLLGGGIAGGVAVLIRRASSSSPGP
jgi:hypothetical protein